MNRVALDLGFIQIYWYSITMFLGVLFGIIVAYIEIKRKKISTEKFENMAFYAIIFGFLGARIYYVLFNLDYYLKEPIEILKVWNGGLAIHGGIIGAVLAIFIYCRKNKLNFIEMLDICAPAILIGQIIGRWGNFFNGEAHGGIVSKAFLEGLHIPQFIIDGMYINGVYYHPTFLYESLLNLICFVVLMILRYNKKIKIGTLVGIYLIWYGVVRFFIESLRTDSLMLGSLKMAQLIGIPMIIIGIILIVNSRKKKHYNEVIE
jgi:phosphatidylglycerol:prolipoprotein diacylglycerol transferase